VATDTHRAIEAAWRIEAPRLIAGLTRLVRDVRDVRDVGDVGVAEELAQDALVAALEQWPAEGVPRNPGAWLMTTAKRRAIDRALARFYAAPSRPGVVRLGLVRWMRPDIAGFGRGCGVATPFPELGCGDTESGGDLVPGCAVPVLVDVLDNHGDGCRPMFGCGCGDELSEQCEVVEMLGAQARVRGHRRWCVEHGDDLVDLGVVQPAVEFLQDQAGGGLFARCCCGAGCCG
jgi:hypothetical protein